MGLISASFPDQINKAIEKRFALLLLVSYNYESTLGCLLFEFRQP